MHAHVSQRHNEYVMTTGITAIGLSKSPAEGITSTPALVAPTVPTSAVSPTELPTQGFKLPATSTSETASTGVPAPALPDDQAARILFEQRQENALRQQMHEQSQVRPLWPHSLPAQLMVSVFGPQIPIVTAPSLASRPEVSSVGGLRKEHRSQEHSPYAEQRQMYQRFTGRSLDGYL